MEVDTPSYTVHVPPSHLYTQQPPDTYALALHHRFERLNQPPRRMNLQSETWLAVRGIGQTSRTGTAFDRDADRTVWDLNMIARNATLLFNRRKTEDGPCGV